VGDLSKLERWRGALWGVFVGDALAMPVDGYSNSATGRNQMSSKT
jgi:ADP-ribosylglycohydrolase